MECGLQLRADIIVSSLALGTLNVMQEANGVEAWGSAEHIEGAVLLDGLHGVFIAASFRLESEILHIIRMRRGISNEWCCR